MVDISTLVRENIRSLTPYSSARSEFTGAGKTFLDANENSIGSPISPDYSRYPDPLQMAVKEKLALLNDVSPSSIFVGSGSDEAIDLLFRIFCRPSRDNAIICPPTYGMYEVAAAINDVTVRRAELTDDFQLDSDAIARNIDADTKLIFICSPNNPSGNLVSRDAILEIAASFPGIVVVDEAYIHFSNGESLISEIGKLRNIVVLQTFSKAWGLAGLRVGIAYADEKIIGLFNKVKPPYNVSQAAQELVLEALNNPQGVTRMVATIITEREKLARDLAQLTYVRNVYPSDANFLLVKLANAREVYSRLLDDDIVVRDRSKVVHCDECLRITVGTEDENRSLMTALKSYEKDPIY